LENDDNYLKKTNTKAVKVVVPSLFAPTSPAANSEKLWNGYRVGWSGLDFCPHTLFGFRL